jgi:hypothetical protein
MKACSEKVGKFFGRFSSLINCACFNNEFLNEPLTLEFHWKNRVSVYKCISLTITSSFNDFLQLEFLRSFISFCCMHFRNPYTHAINVT